MHTDGKKTNLELSLPLPHWELLDYPFYERDTATVAQALLGAFLVSTSGTEITIGKVVETEAYLGQHDPACHSACGMTRRNAVMFGPAGFAYVYLIYGIHYCFNVTTDKKELPAAVLIRALEPVAGLAFMQQRRGTPHLRNLCSGPAKLVQAMGISYSVNGTSVVDGPVNFYRDPRQEPFHIKKTGRIGISQAKELPLRFYITGNGYISKK